MQKWAHAFRDTAYYAVVDTNNGTESLNKALKYSYIPKQKSLSLSGIASLLIERFLPDMYQKYVFQSYKLSEEYRAYNDSIPSYLKGCPKSVILHCLQRTLKCHKFSVEDVNMSGGGSFEVHMAGTEKRYAVNFQKPECTCSTCKDWARHHIPCKHFFAIFQYFPNWNWLKLPQSYQDSYLSADTTAVQQYITKEEHLNECYSDVVATDCDYTMPCLPPIPKQKYLKIFCP